MVRFALVLFACTAALILAISGSFAANLGMANDYGIFVFENLIQSSTDCGGRVAVGGNADISSYFVGKNISDTSIPSLVVGGNLNFSNGQVKGDVPHVGGTWNVKSANFTSCKTYDPETDVDFTAAKNYLTTTSTAWSKLTTNIGSVDNYYNNITLTGTDSDLNVFNLTAQDLLNCCSLTIKAPSSSTVLVNISGTTCEFSGFGTSLLGVNKNKVLYNFSEATSLNIFNIGVEGSVLAPYAKLGFWSGQINGSLIGNSLDNISVVNNGEVHNKLFQGDIPTVPEPPTWLLVSAGGLLISVYRLRRR